MGQQLAARTAGNGCGPAGQVRPRTVEDEDLAVTRWARVEAAGHPPAACCAGQQSRRRSGDRSSSLRPQATCLGLAPLVRPGPTGGDSKWQCGALRWLVSQVDRPQRTPDTSQVLGLGYLLMAQELGPRAVRCVTEVVSRPFARRMPPTRWLRAILPKKRIAGIGMAESDHVAGEETRAAASSRTRCGPWSSGCHALPRSWAGAWLPSSFRGRLNHRRMPKSLYAPARSPMTRARKWRRAAITSGVARLPDR